MPFNTKPRINPRTSKRRYTHSNNNKTCQLNEKSTSGHCFDVRVDFCCRSAALLYESEIYPEKRHALPHKKMNCNISFYMKIQQRCRVKTVKAGWHWYESVDSCRPDSQV